MLLVAADDFGEARGVLGKVRALLDTQVGALVGESYERAYKGVVEAQQVAELEEVRTPPPPPPGTKRTRRVPSTVLRILMRARPPPFPPAAPPHLPGADRAPSSNASRKAPRRAPLLCRRASGVAGAGDDVQRTAARVGGEAAAARSRGWGPC
jgi:hypothetical protein